MRKILLFALVLAMAFTMTIPAMAKNEKAAGTVPGAELFSTANEWYVTVDNAGKLTVSDNKNSYSYDYDSAGTYLIGLQKNFTGQLKLVSFVPSTPNVTYTVTFIVDGAAVKTQTVARGGYATAPSDPTKEGYKFAGWSVPFNNVTSNLTVTAQWERLTTPINPGVVLYGIIYDANDGSGRVSELQRFISEGDINTYKAGYDGFTREGYKLAGWATSANGAIVTEVEIAPLKVVTFYAIWVESTNVAVTDHSRSGNINSFRISITESLTNGLTNVITSDKITQNNNSNQTVKIGGYNVRIVISGNVVTVTIQP